MQRMVFFRLRDRNGTERNVEDYRAVDARSTLSSRVSIMKSGVGFLYTSSYIRIISRPSGSIFLDIVPFVSFWPQPFHFSKF